MEQVEETGIKRGRQRKEFSTEDMEVGQRPSIIIPPLNETMIREGEKIDVVEPGSANNDYYDICTNCLKANAGPVAWCPKAEKVIPNISAEAEVVARREFWLQSFGNIRSDYARD